MRGCLSPTQAEFFHRVVSGSRTPAHIGGDPKPTAVIVAVDGALLDRPPARSPHRLGRNSATALPAPDSRMLKLIKLERARGHKVFILTSASERFRANLHAWLRRLGLESDGILMRADGEQCPDPQLKTAMAAAVTMAAPAILANSHITDRWNLSPANRHAILETGTRTLYLGEDSELAALVAAARKTARALNAALNLDLGTEAERLLRAEITSCLR